MKKIVKVIFVIAFGISIMSFIATVKESNIDRSVFQNHKWEKLGQRIVNMKGDHDEIPVTVYEGAFTKLKFKVLKAPIHVRNIKVVFGNGQSKNVNINRRFATGSESKVIDLPGNKRIIKKIVMNYKTVPGVNGRAVVVVWGKH